MAELLTSSLLWRVLLAIGGWFSALAHSSKVLTFLGRTWRSSRTRAWCIRRLASADAPTRESRAAKRFERLNARLAARHGLKDCLDHSLLCRIWRFFVRCGQNSRLFSWLLSDGLHGVYQYIVAVPIPSSWMTHTETSVRTRVYSIFGSPNIMGDFMTMFAPMAAGLAYCTKNRKLQIAAWICAFCMCFGCLFTMSRAAWMALALAIVIFVLLVDRRLLVLLLAAACVACTLPFVRSRIGFLFTADFAEANTSGGRAGRKLVALTLLEQRGKLTGVGLGMFGGAVAMQNQVIDHQDYFYVDNYYLKLMIEMGYMGLAAFVLTVLGFLANACRALYRTAQQKKQGLSRLYPLCAGIFAGLCGVLVHCGFENIFEEPYMMAYFWSLAGLLMWAGFLRQTPGEVQA